MLLTDELKKEYRELYDSCVIDPSKTEIVGAIVKRIQKNLYSYTLVAGQLNIPWQFVAIIHNLEAALKFSCHLHNGDSLMKRTIHVPAGRPVDGTPPFTWEESAVDALTLRKLDQWKDWSVEGMLYQMEGYNGWGYRLHHPWVLSPYLWSFSNHYTRGKYIADGTWSDPAVSGQCGGAVLLSSLPEKGIVLF